MIFLFVTYFVTFLLLTYSYVPETAAAYLAIDRTQINSDNVHAYEAIRITPVDCGSNYMNLC